MLPGVTVEARSPQIIEQVRTVITDGNGLYLIVALEPGTYSITYTLPGFSTFVREGIELQTGFTASIDVELSVGDIAETVMVTGASPVVDIQNVDQRQVMDREVIDSIPTGKSFQSYALLVPGMVGSQPSGTTLSQDAGGITAQSFQMLSIHGSTPQDQETAINGIDVSDASSGGLVFGIIADGNYEEMAVEYSTHSAEIESGGVRINLIPREGANQFSGALFATATFPEMQANNVDQDLRDRGLGVGNVIDKVWLINPSFGGPIVRDRLWFFVGHTSQRADVRLAGIFKNQDPSAFLYAPDLNNQAIDENLIRDQLLHLTLQATPKDKVKLYWGNSSTDKPHLLQGNILTGLFLSPEAALNNIDKVNTYQANWVRPHTNRLLFEAGFSIMPNKHDTIEPIDAVPTLPGMLEASTVTMYRNMSGWFRNTRVKNFRGTNGFRGAVSYVTGSHNLKVGVNGLFVTSNHVGSHEADWTSLVLLRGNPFRANFYTPSRSAINDGSTVGIYAQDQWTVDRLTVNAGVRFDRVNNSYPDQTRVATTWAPEFFVTGVEAVGWNDVQPRLGVAYDLFGDGRTALKASASRYGARNLQRWAASLNPVSTNNSQSRTWDDQTCLSGECIAGDGFPQGDPLDPLPNGELLTGNRNPAFGLPIINTFYDQAWAFGWGNRFSNWEFSGSVQQELMAGVALDVGYFRRNFVNFSVEDNRAVDTDDFERFTIAAPTDPDLPGGGGGTLTLLDSTPEAFGRVPDFVTTSADSFGGESRTFNGVDIALDARLEGLLFQGGVSTGTVSSDYCDLASQVPETIDARSRGVQGREASKVLDFCNISTAWLTQIKLLGSYTLPYDIQIAGTYQSLSGPERKAIHTYTSAEFDAALGRPHTTGGESINVLEPGTEYGERFHQVDLRFTKIISLGGSARLRAMFDLFNIFNANAVTKEGFGLGANYLQPDAIMPGRLGKFAFQFDF